MGGACWLGLDYRLRSTPRYALVPFGDFDYESTEILGDTLVEALEKLAIMETE